MSRLQRFVVILVSAALCLGAGTLAQADLLLSDDFDNTADPAGLNDDLTARQTGEWATTDWDVVDNGATIDIRGNQLSIGGTASSWNDAYLHNSGAGLVGSQYTIATKIDFTNGYPGRGGAIAVKDDQRADIASGVGSLFMDMNPTNGGADLYWELAYNSGSGIVGSEGTIANWGKDIYDVQIQVDETGATKTATLLIDSSTICTLNWNPGSNSNRYICLAYNATYGGTVKFDNFSLSQIPEPSTLVLSIVGLFGILVYACASKSRQMITLSRLQKRDKG